GEAGGGVLAAGRAAGGIRVLVDLVRAAVHDPNVADVVRIDRDADRRGVGRVDSPAAEQRTRHVVLVNLVRAAIVDDPERCAVGHDAFAVRVGTVEAEAAGGVLAAGKTTRGAGVP